MDALDAPSIEYRDDHLCLHYHLVLHVTVDVLVEKVLISVTLFVTIDCVS